MLKVKLPIFFKTEDFNNAELCGKDIPFKHCDQRLFTFYNINGISPYEDIDEQLYTSIHSNGCEFICSLPPLEVEKMIDNANK